MRQQHVDPIYAEGVAFAGRRPRPAVGGRLLLVFIFPFPLLERVEIIEDVMADLLEVFGNFRARVFLLQFLNEAVHQH